MDDRKKAESVARSTELLLAFTKDMPADKYHTMMALTEKAIGHLLLATAIVGPDVAAAYFAWVCDHLSPEGIAHTAGTSQEEGAAGAMAMFFFEQSKGLQVAVLPDGALDEEMQEARGATKQ